MIPYSRQSINRKDIRDVTAVLRSNYLTQGNTVPRFEAEVAQYCGARFGVATNSATSALHLACLALGLQPGDRVWTSAISFVSSSNCALFCGAEVDFVDIDPRTFCMSIDSLKLKLSKAERDGNLPKIVIPVHFGGQSCQMREIRQLSDKYGFSIIEDASHALGGEHLNNKIGSCEYSDITVFSFHPVKPITTGEGGMAMTNSEKLSHLMQLLRSHGLERDKTKFLGTTNSEIWNYQQVYLGFNYRMSDIHAALGLSQLSRIDKFNLKRNQIARNYSKSITNLGVTSQQILDVNFSTFHLFVVRIQLSQAKLAQKKIFQGLLNEGIKVNLHYTPIHLQPYYQALGFKRGDYPEAESFFGQALSLPVFPKLSKLQQRTIIKTFNRLIDSLS